MKADNVTVTDARVRNALYVPFKQFLEAEKISEQITKKIEEHSIKKGKVIEVYHYLDKSLVKLSDGEEVEAWHLHRCLGSIVDLYTPEGEQVLSERINEPCIMPKYDLKALVAEVGKTEYVLLGYYNPNMVGAFSPAESGSYYIRTLTDTSQGGLKISPREIKLTSNNGAVFKEQDVGESKDIVYANNEDTPSKSEVYTRDVLYTKDKLYTKTEVDELIKKAVDDLKKEILGDDDE